jgi:release factor glutamine methyltransferase
VNLKQALTLAADKLAVLKDIDAPTLEAEVLLRFCLNLDRASLHLKLKEFLTSQQSEQFFKMIERRLQNEPTSHIIGTREFYGLDFKVDRRVLIPRPETELMVEETLKLVRNRKIRSIVDIGTGSGAIAVSLAVCLHNAEETRRLLRENRELAMTNLFPAKVQICATDISPEALEVARLNAQKHSVDSRIKFLQGDLLEPLPQKVDIVLANLPYVSAAEVKSMPSAQYEPHIALDGGEAGLDQIYRLIGQLRGGINSGGYVLMEIGMGQGATVTDYLRRILPDARIEVLPDLAGIERVVKAEMG